MHKRINDRWLSRLATGYVSMPVKNRILIYEFVQLVVGTVFRIKLEWIMGVILTSLFLCNNSFQFTEMIEP